MTASPASARGWLPPPAPIHGGFSWRWVCPALPPAGLVWRLHSARGGRGRTTRSSGSQPLLWGPCSRLGCWVELASGQPALRESACVPSCHMWEPTALRPESRPHPGGTEWQLRGPRDQVLRQKEVGVGVCVRARGCGLRAGQAGGPGLSLLPTRFHGTDSESGRRGSAEHCLK